jgi:hypothetical protein
MSTYRIIDDFTIGDTYKIIRDIDSAPEGAVITDAYLTVKKSLLDSDALAAFKLHITLTGGDGAIYLYDDDSYTLQFVVTPSGSSLMDSNSTYDYDIHVNLNNGEKYSLENGKLLTDRHVTQIH